MKKNISFCLLITLLLTSVCSVNTLTVNAEVSTKDTSQITKAGWYRTGYELKIGGSSTGGGFLVDNATYTNTTSVSDKDGKKIDLDKDATTISTVENDLTIGFWRTMDDSGSIAAGYSEKIHWDTPSEYIEPETTFTLKNLSRTNVSISTWHPGDLHVSFNIYGELFGAETKMATTGTDSTTDINEEYAGDLTSKTKMPAAPPQTKAYLLMNLSAEAGLSDTQHFVRAIYTYTYMAPKVDISAKSYYSKTTASKVGWYLTNYNFIKPSEDTLKSTGKYFDGSTYTDIRSFYDANGKPSTDAFLENELYIHNLTNNSKNLYSMGDCYHVKWDTPEKFYAADSLVKLEGIYNHVINGSEDNHLGIQSWIENGTSRYDLRDAEGENYIYETKGTALTANTKLPAGTANNQKLTLFINLKYTKAVYTYTWISAKSGATAIKTTIKTPKDTLVLKGKNKDLTTKIKLKAVPANAKITYSSTKKKIATVSKKGIVKAKRSGKVTIVVTIKTKTSKKTLRCKITVKRK